MAVVRCAPGKGLAAVAEQLDEITIRFPARGGYLAISRLNATAMAASIGFDVDQLDDLRLAVDEAVTWLVADKDSEGSIELTIRCHDDRLVFRGVRTAADLPDRKLSELVEAIMGATVDHYDTGSEHDGQRYIELSKHTDGNG